MYVYNYNNNLPIFNIFKLGINGRLLANLIIPSTKRGLSK